MEIQTVLCPIDFSSLSDFELRLAAEVCETFGARLVLHHNLDAPSSGAPGAVVDEAGADERLRALRERLPAAVEAEIRISSGPVERVILDLVAELGADLVTLGSHGWSSKQRASVSERILAQAPCPVLAFQEGRGEHTVRLRGGRPDPGRPDPGDGELRAVVPTDFSKAAAAAVDYAFDLARATALELHLLSVCASDQEVDATRRKLAQRVPPDLEGRVECHAAIGAVGDGIASLARSLDAELIIMGEHAPDFFRRYLSHDTACEMLHRSRCPVWFVPLKAARA